MHSAPAMPRAAEDSPVEVIARLLAERVRLDAERCGTARRDAHPKAHGLATAAFVVKCGNIPPLYLAGLAVFVLGLLQAVKELRQEGGDIRSFAAPAGACLFEGVCVSADRILYFSAVPMVGAVEGFRAAVLNQPFPSDVLGISALSATALVAVGIQYFLQVERRFADVI